MLALNYALSSRAPQFGWTLHAAQPKRWPNTPLTESADGFHWTVDVPGIDEGNLNLQIEGREACLKTE